MTYPTLKLIREALPADERTAFTAIVEASPPKCQEAIEKYLLLRKKKAARNKKNACNDVEKRSLVGARLPRNEVESIRKAAEQAGMSLYQFTKEALLEKVSPPGTD